MSKPSTTKKSTRVPTPPELRPPPSVKRVSGLDGLRGIAALAVLVFHVASQTGATAYETVNGVTRPKLAAQYLARLDVAVPIFFVLSSYLLFRPFLQSLFSGAPMASTKWFWWRRFWRIYPAYWLALFLGAALFYPTIRTWRDAFVFAALVQSYDAWRALGGLAQAWSLNVEVVLYLFLPLFAALLAWIARRTVAPPASGEPGDDAKRARRLDHLVLGSLLLCVVVAYAFRWYSYEWNPSWRNRGVTWFPNHLDTFALGMGLAWARVVGEQRNPAAIPRWLRFLADQPAWSWILAYAGFWAVSSIGLPLTIAPVGMGQAFAQHALYGAVAALVVLPAALGPLGDRVVGPLLGWKPLEWIGTISYGMYLWHLMMVAFWIERTGGQAFAASFWPVLALTLVSSIALGWLSFVIIEAPLQRFAHRVARGR